MQAVEQISFSSLQPHSNFFSPKSAPFARASPYLLGRSNKTLLGCSSSKSYKNYERLPGSQRRCKDQKKPRNASPDVIPAFSQAMYDRIESFLDEENIFIVSPRQPVHSKINKASFKLMRISTNPEIQMNKTRKVSENDCNIDNCPCMPSIIARRTSSAGVMKNIQNTLISFTKSESFQHISFFPESQKLELPEFDTCSVEQMSPL